MMKTKNKIIKEEYINIDTSRALKHIGFDVETDKLYVSNENTYFRLVVPKKAYIRAFSKYFYPMPTQSLAMQWIRENHNLHIFAKKMYNFSTKNYEWGYWIQDIISNELILRNYGFNTYEEAIEDGLQKELEFIKEKEYAKDNVQ